MAKQGLLDETLTPAERLRPFHASIDGRDMPIVDEEAARVIFAIGASSTEPGLRATAWHLLDNVDDPDFKSVLLEDLARHPAENVRGGAASALSGYADDPAVRAALEQATSDSSGIVRRWARSALRGGG